MKKLKLTDRDIENIYARNILARGIVIIVFSVIAFIIGFFIGKLI